MIRRGEAETKRSLPVGRPAPLSRRDGAARRDPRRLVLFDLDDTLSDRSYASRRALASLRAEFPYWRSWPVSRLVEENDRLLELLHHDVLNGTLTEGLARRRRLRALAQRGSGEPSENELSAIVRAYRAASSHASRPVPGAPSLLSALRRTSLVGVVTNHSRRPQLVKLEQLGLRHLVDFVVASGEDGVEKPDPRIFRRALERADCPTENAVVVGDSWENDIVGARSAHVRAIWLNRAGRPAPEPLGSRTRAVSSLRPGAQLARRIARWVPGASRPLAIRANG